MVTELSVRTFGLVDKPFFAVGYSKKGIPDPLKIIIGRFKRVLLREKDLKLNKVL